MKKLCALALVFALFTCLAAAEDANLADWVKQYNEEAAKHSATLLDDSAFETVEGVDFPAAMLDDDTLIMLSIDSSASLEVFAVQALPGDERILPILSCALACSDTDISYEDAKDCFDGILNELNSDGDSVNRMFNGWYVMGGYAIEDGEAGIAVAFGYVGSFAGSDDADGSDDSDGGSIWEGLLPGDDEQPSGGNGSSPTPAPQKGRYKA